MGCLKNMLAGVGCGTLLIVGGVAGYHYRAQLWGLVESVRGGGVADTTAAAGYASEDALTSARRKERRMAGRGGPASVTLSAAELAALVRDGLHPVG